MQPFELCFEKTNFVVRCDEIFELKNSW